MSRSSELLQFVVSVTALVGLILLATGESRAQPPGRGFRGFDGLDQDGSGVIERAELENLPERFRERLESLIEEGEPGITRERFEESMQSFRSRWREGRGPMRGEGEPADNRPDGEPSDQNGTQENDERESRRPRRNRNEEQPPGETGEKQPNPEKGETVIERSAPAHSGGAKARYGQRKNGGKANANGSAGEGSGKSEGGSNKGERVGLPDDWKMADGDGDGQIGLYECPRQRFAEFRQRDLNKDGFLTAPEIRRATQVSEEKPVTVSQPAVETASETPASAPTADSPAEAAKSEVLAAVAHIPKDLLNEADAAFKRLDVDSSGTIEPEEWSVSKRLKPRFEGAGVDLSKPISHLDFLKSYAVAVPKK